MARYKLLIKPSAVKEIEAIPYKKDRRRLVDRIKGLANDPRPPGGEKLSGQDRYRVRQGNYRIVCSVADQARIIRIVKVGHRKDVYR
ncbi:type II toxin-antitoxin system RelE/ParE family toxin [Acidobacteria bacterium AH-259-O06]|nr:type II toxin-antitoxin system RelE/ParE family toxin [Acidobacteria bacterium AH-259-O06]